MSKLSRWLWGPYWEITHAKGGIYRVRARSREHAIRKFRKLLISTITRDFPFAMTYNSAVVEEVISETTVRMIED